VGQVQTVQLELSAPVCPHISMREGPSASAPAWADGNKRGSCLLELHRSSLTITQDEEVRRRTGGGWDINHLSKWHQMATEGNYLSIYFSKVQF